MSRTRNISRAGAGQRVRRRIRRQGRGFTLAEGLLASMFVALSVGAVVAAVNTSVRQSQLCGQQTMAQNLARQLMEQIIATPFADPQGRKTLSGQGNNRASFDHVGAFNQYSDTTQSLKDSANQSAGPKNQGLFTRSVSVQYLWGPAAQPGPGDFALVTVTVTTPRGQSHRLTTMLANTNFKP